MQTHMTAAKELAIIMHLLMGERRMQQATVVQGHEASFMGFEAGGFAAKP